MQTGPQSGLFGRALIVAVATVMLSTTAAFASSNTTSVGSASYQVNLPLQMGQSSSDVATLQQLLLGAGFNPGPVDGVFGNLTERAVVAFQEAHDLPLTGKVDQTEWDLLVGSLLIERGDRGDAVRSLQQLLAGSGFNPGPIDGIFGGLTEQAVSQFQSSKGLTVTGRVDQGTWDALNNNPDAPAVLLRRGDRGEAVRTLQLMLATSGVNPGPIDGIFGGMTESAVGKAQVANSFIVTGIVDQALWNILASNPDTPDVLLQRGDVGSEVEAVQELVKLVGFDPGPIDGVFGSLTERAIGRFQRVHGLPGDGTLNQQTLDKMNVIKPQALTAYDYGYTGSSGTEQWRSLVTEVFTEWGLHEEVCGTGANADKCIGNQIENALKIMHCESRGVPMVVNYLSGTTGLFQHRPAFWDTRAARARDHIASFDVNATPYNPEHNVVVAALLVWESRETLIGNSSRTGPWDDGPEPWGHWDGSSRTCVDPPLVTP